MQRRDDFEIRRQHLKNLSEEELEKRFWELTEKIVYPLVELAYTHTSPSIERSVLLRMGIDSISARAIVDKCCEKGLLGKGAGHIVLKYALFKDVSIREASKRLASGQGWDEIDSVMKIQINPESIRKLAR